MRFISLAALLALTLTLVLSGCAAPTGAGGNSTNGSDMASVSMLPKEMQAAPERVRTAYQFAITHPDALENVPCYCGCGAMDHTSNLSCYVKERKAGGQFTFDDHALGCSLCVDISQDVMRMTGEGKSPGDIRAAVVATYSKFGPPNQ